MGNRIGPRNGLRSASAAGSVRALDCDRGLMLQYRASGRQTPRWWDRSQLDLGHGRRAGACQCRCGYWMMAQALSRRGHAVNRVEDHLSDEISNWEL